MAFHISARIGAIGALLLSGCASGGGGTGSTTDVGTDNGSGSGSGGTTDTGGTGTTTGTATGNLYTVTDLTADQPGAAASVLSPLVNAWGLVAFRNMFWIADNGTGKVSIVDAAGKPAAGLTAAGLPASDAIDLGEGITGVATNDSAAMQIDHDDLSACGPASLIFASEHGQLLGINTDLSMTGGFVLVDRSDVMADYTGVATLDVALPATDGTGPTTTVLTLAADFHNARIDVFDEGFKLVTTPMFSDASVPAGFAPFNVWIGSSVVYVSYAQQNATQDDSVTGAGLGFIAAFDITGKLLWTAKGNELNAPWGMALSADPAALVPSSLLVGNFGDGRITMIDPMDGTITGQLMTSSKDAVTIDGLWGLAFGAGVTGARPNGLYFAAGPGDEMHGMFGVVTPAAPTTPTTM